MFMLTVLPFAFPKLPKPRTRENYYLNASDSRSGSRFFYVNASASAFKRVRLRVQTLPPPRSNAFTSFLDASLHLYKRVCPSVRNTFF